MVVEGIALLWLEADQPACICNGRVLCGGRAGFMFGCLWVYGMGSVECLVSGALGCSSATSPVCSDICSGDSLQMRLGRWSDRMHPVTVPGLLAGLVCGFLAGIDAWAVLWTSGIGVAGIAWVA